MKALILIIVFLFCFYLTIRVNRVYNFIVNLSDHARDTVLSKLNEYNSDEEFNLHFAEYEELFSMCRDIVMKHSYNKLLFRIDLPLKYDIWYTDEELKLIGLKK